MTTFLRRHRMTTIALLLALAAAFAVVSPVSAQGITSNELLDSQVGTELGASAAPLPVTIARIVRAAFGLLGTIALLLIMYAGFLWMTAAGDDEKVTRAKKTLSASVIGLVIMLSAFSITSFILNSLVSATTQGPGGGPGGGGGGGGGFGGGGAAGFRPTAIQPSGTLAKYDVVASITFSAAPTGDVANIRENVLLEREGLTGRSAVEYEPVVQNNTIRLYPTVACPAPNEARKCLEPDSDYVVTVRSGLRNADQDDPRTVNCGISAVCSQRFRTGDAVATELPTARIATPSDGQSLPAGDFAQIQSLLTDPNGIADVEYFADGAFFIADGNAQSIAPATYVSQVAWDTAAFTPVKTVRLKARVTNIDGDSAESDEVKVTLRPAHCFNGVEDAGEAGPDCGGPDCGSCTGGVCTEASACASGQCEAGRCVENPRILSIDPPDGAPGSFVTITGQHFGGTKGVVTFLGGADDADDRVALVASCTQAWADSRVVVLVPEGAVTGPIRLTTVTGKSDATNDLEEGPIINNFIVNDVPRPGICEVDPVSVKTGRPVTVTGNGFGTTQADSRVQLARAALDCTQVQPWEQASEASVVETWSDASLTPTVPNLETGANGTMYLLRVMVGGQASNHACLRLEPPEAGTDPRVDLISPSAGSVGTYVTLSGANFGSSGTVRFRASAGTAVGDVAFPAQCAIGYWKDSGVTVKVPAKFTTPADTAIALGAYSVQVVRADGRASNVVTFSVNTDPVPPGICRIEPDNGPAGAGVAIHGENFGDVDSSDLGTFLTQHPDAVRFHDGKDVTTLGQWRDAQIATAVPSGAVTGPVQVRTFAGATPTASNAVPFLVRDCRTSGGDAACGSGRTCCADGSCRAECGGPANVGGFAWQFSTGPIPVFPVVIENATCQIAPPTTMPSPNPFRGATGVCSDIGGVAVRFSLPMETATMTSANLILEECAGDSSLDLPCAPVAGAGVPSVTTYDTDGRTLLSIPVGGLAPSKWHRLTIRDEVTSVEATGRPAQQLDGDFDGKGGGDYVTNFKTGSEPCVISAVDVQPANGLIASPTQDLTYVAFPLSSKCVILQCTTRDAAWSSSDTSKATVAPAGGIGQCTTQASPVDETDPGPPIRIKADIDGKSDEGNLIVDYANPRVESYGPRDCDVACVNAVGFARFNVDMAVDGPGSILSNVKFFRCVNESCLAYAAELQLDPRYIASAKLLTIGNPMMLPDSYYRVVILGTATSDGGAPLTGLNFEDKDFSWTFRTRANANPCGPQRIAIEPSKTTLRAIGQLAPVVALPFSSPDACAAEGQLLNDSSFNWSWSRSQNPSNPASYAFLPNVPPGAVLNTNPNLPARCSSQCLYTGSEPVGTPVCGNGQLERGEACDTPGSDGCGDTCLMLGNSDVGAGADQCGNGAVEAARGEECDQGSGNGTAASGCSSRCVLRGSLPGLSACGNGSSESDVGVGEGEACDDGNTTNGDGCSSICLREGSKQDVPVCGNGVLENGEQCDYVKDATGSAERLLVDGKPESVLGASDESDPASPSFACGPRCLLRGNPTSCAAAGCCGNGVIDPKRGEGCDSGSLNGKPGSGCTSRCTKAGADAELRAFCGDTVITARPANASTGVQHGGGEECEASVLDDNIDPVQVLQAKTQCDAKNSCTASVDAAVGQVLGSGQVSVECSCRADSDCSAFGSGLTCGSDACCYSRPAPPDIRPKGQDECLNALVTVDFEEEMSVTSLTGRILVESCGAVAAAPSGLGSWLASALEKLGEFFRSLVGLKATAADCTPVKGKFTHIAVGVVNGAKRTRSLFAPEQLYAADSTFRVSVLGGPNGVRTTRGVGYPEGAAAIQEFSTGDEVCRLDVVAIDPAQFLLSSSSEVVNLTATPLTHRSSLAEPIAPIPGVYDWSWSWKTVPATGTGPSILKLTVPTPADVTADVQAQEGKNGKEQVLAIATIESNATSLAAVTGSGTGMKIVGKADATSFLCEQPWPRRDPATGAWAPYVDPETHFEFYYCRDAAGGPLPELLPAPVEGQATFEPGMLRFCKTTKETGEPDQPKLCISDLQCDTGDTCQSKDLFFRFQPDSRVKDAFGLRVFENPERLSPSAWYAARKFSGKTQAFGVDDYPGLKDDRTVYVGAVDKYGDPILKSYIYVLGFNDAARPETRAIFDQLMKNTRFNTNLDPPGHVSNICRDSVGEPASPPGSGEPVSCSSDLDCFAALNPPPAGLHCDAKRDKLHRDIRRWEDVRRMTDALDGGGSFPTLESGTFVRGLTTSKWPSWSQMGGAAASDPLNRLNRCAAFGSECALTRTACESDGDCDADKPDDKCKPRFEGETCYDSRSGVFMCPKGSSAYIYRAVGGQDYQLFVDFEYDAHPWEGISCLDKFNESGCEASPGCSWDGSSCDTRVVTDSICTGLPGGPDRCLKGGEDCEESADCAEGDVCVPKDAALFGAAVSAFCGNGLLEAGEVCEIGMQQTIACASGGQQTQRCSAQCQWSDATACPGAAVCGNAATEAFANESCDDGSQNGQYNRCRSGDLGCRKRCVNVTSRTRYVLGDVAVGTCTTDADCSGLGFQAVCTDRMNFCGDGVRQVAEACDDGVLNGQYGQCAWDCGGPGPRCGDAETNGAEQCDGDQASSAGVCVETASTLNDGSTASGAFTPCVADSGCGSGQRCAVCAPTAEAIPQSRTKGCNPATAGEGVACTFADWSVCKPLGSCGNGKVEGSEQCDAGSGNGPDAACLTSCKLNVCNDGFMHVGVEQCDNGTSNGVACTSKYGLTCNYCKNDCTIETVSGSFCGDKVIQSPPETCDAGPVFGWCSRTYQDLANPGPGIRGCTTNNGCLPGACRNYPGASFPPSGTGAIRTDGRFAGVPEYLAATVRFAKGALMAPILGPGRVFAELASMKLALPGDPLPPSDTTPPDTVITAGPSSYANSTTANFTFEARKPEIGPSVLDGTAGFTCKLDAASFVTCSVAASGGVGGHKATGLSQGSHTLTIVATDASDNDDPTPATRTWIVDTVLPVATFPDFSVTDVSGTAPITVSATDLNGPLNVALTVPCGTRSPSSASIASGASVNINWNTTGCTAGSKSVTLTATDRAGNIGTVVRSYNVTIAAPPDTTFPTVSGLVVTPADATINDTVTISGNGADNVALAKIELFLTISGVKELRQTCVRATPPTSDSCSVSVGELAIGTYTATVEATDTAGNKASTLLDFTVVFARDDSSTTSGIAFKDFALGGLLFLEATAQGAPPPEGAPCWSATDCAATQYCEGGEGQCIAYNTQCVPEPYTNVKAAATAKKCSKSGVVCTSTAQCGATGGTCVVFRQEGACNYCTNSCGGAAVKSPLFCGDEILQKEFGEACDPLGDPSAVGEGSTYVCRNDCVYDPNGGFCGDQIFQAGEICDLNQGNSRIASAVVTGRVLDAIYVTGVSGVKVELREGTRKLADTTTNSNGTYTFSGLNAQNTCKLQKWTVVVKGSAEDYFDETTDQFGFSCAPGNAVKNVSRNRLEMEHILVVPKPGPYEYLVLTEWDGNLGGNYLDLHLRRPDQAAGTQGTYWNSQGVESLNSNPHSYLYCYHEDGGSNCSSFSSKPETMKFKWADNDGDPFYGSGNFKAWVTDYNCGGGSDSNSKLVCRNFINYKLRFKVYDSTGLVHTFNTPVGSTIIPGGEFGQDQTVAPYTRGYWELFSVESGTGEFKPWGCIGDAATCATDQGNFKSILP